MKKISIIVLIIMGLALVALLVLVTNALISYQIKKITEQTEEKDLKYLTNSPITIKEHYLGEEVGYESLDEINEEMTRLRNELDELNEKKYDLRNEEILRTFERVVNNSMNIEIDEDKTFNELYNGYVEIFDQKYDKTFDVGQNYTEYVQTVQELIGNNYAGDCDDYALFFYVLARKKGLNVRLVLSEDHAWIQIKKGNKWIEYGSVSNRVCKLCITEENLNVKYFLEV